MSWLELLFCALLLYPALASATTPIEAVEISKSTTKVKELLDKNPDAFVIVLQETYMVETEARPCWEVKWWTKERVESKLRYHTSEELGSLPTASGDKMNAYSKLAVTDVQATTRAKVGMPGDPLGLQYKIDAEGLKKDP